MYIHKYGPRALMYINCTYICIQGQDLNIYLHITGPECIFRFKDIGPMNVQIFSYEDRIRIILTRELPNPCSPEKYLFRGKCLNFSTREKCTNYTGVSNT